MIKAIEVHEKASRTFLDFAKSSDIVNHDILLNKLECYSIRGPPLSLLRSYLTDRTRRVKIGKCISNPLTETCGVARDSILGHFLFLLYINNIYLSSLIVMFHLFADDTCMFHSHPNISALETELNIALYNVTNWLRANELTLNVSKSNLLLFNVGSRPQNKFEIFIHHEQLQQKEYAEYLGIFIASKPSWKKHNQTTNLKISKEIVVIRKMQHYLQEKQLISIYNAFVKPYLEYGSLTWGELPKQS